MIPVALPGCREYLAFPHSLWATASRGVICYVAGRLFRRGVLLTFFLFV
jgi:hypothetical protein